MDLTPRQPAAPSQPTSTPLTFTRKGRKLKAPTDDDGSEQPGTPSASAAPPATQAAGKSAAGPGTSNHSSLYVSLSEHVTSSQSHTFLLVQVCQTEVLYAACRTHLSACVRCRLGPCTAGPVCSQQGQDSQPRWPHGVRRAQGASQVSPAWIWRCISCDGVHAFSQDAVHIVHGKPAACQGLVWRQMQGVIQGNTSMLWLDACNGAVYKPLQPASTSCRATACCCMRSSSDVHLHCCARAGKSTSGLQTSTMSSQTSRCAEL